MSILFDLHAERGRFAIWRKHPDGRYKIELRTLQGQLLGEIPAELLPLGPSWSPDGSTVAFSSNDGLIYVYRLGDTRPTVVFANAALMAGFCEWAVGGKRLFFSAYDKETGAPPSIYDLDLESGRAVQLTNDAKTVDRFPHPSPSGEWVAFQRQFLDEPEVPRRVYVVEVQSGQSFPLLEAVEGDYDTGRHCWSPDSSSLLVAVSHQGRRELRVVRLPDRTTVWSYESGTIRGGAFSPQGDRILCVCTGELLSFAYPEGALLRRLSLASLSPVRVSLTGAQVGFDQRANTVYFVGENSCLYRWRIDGNCDCILEEHPPARPAFTHEEYRVISRDGRQVPVQRFIPPTPKAPAILYIHGGPFGAIDPDDPFMLRLLAEGIEFICVAYRGSSGYGTEHEDANRGEYGRADVWDILAAGFDWKKRAGEDRRTTDRPLIIAGYSYGGFLTFLALAQEEIPWAGGMAMWPVSGMHRMQLHQSRAFQQEADRLAQARIERSPLEQAGRIRVPLLIFHGALDTSATTEEMQSIRHSVMSRGGKCELIFFEDDTHGLFRHRDELHARVLRFLREFE